MPDLTPYIQALTDINQPDHAHTQLLRGTFTDPASNIAKDVILEGYPAYDEEETLLVLNRVTRQITVHEKLSHPNIVPALGMCMYKGLPLIVYPFYKNGFVFDYLRSNPDASRINLVIDVAKGLQYLHEHGIIHGYLAPANILVADTGHALLTNFSRAKIVGHQGLTTQAPADLYQAPEGWINKNTAQLTRGADVYSYGLIALHILSGKQPQIGATQTLMFSDFPSVKSEVWNRLEACWQTDPKLRPAIAEVLSALESIALEAS